MDPEKYQKELFGEFAKPKRFFPRLSDFFPKADFERNVVFTLTLDRLVFIAIAIIMVIVAVYALGVEVGKSRTPQETQNPVTRDLSEEPSKPVVQAASLSQPLPVQAPPVKSVPKAIVVSAAKPYTLAIGAFTRRDTAVREVEKLTKAGFNATSVISGRFFVVCVGAYPDKTSLQSQRDLTRMRQSYKDAYFKLI